MKLTPSLRRNLDELERRLHMERNDDMILRRFTALGQSCAVIYIDGMSGGDLMSQHIMRPLLQSAARASGAEAKALAMDRLIEITETKTAPDYEAAVEAVMCGQSLLLIDTVAEAMLMDTRSFAKRSVSQPVSETIVFGPHEAFNENIRDNLTLLHRMLHSPELICRMLSVGTVIPTQVALCYLNGVCPRGTVQELEKRLAGAAVDHVLTSGTLEQMLEDDPYAPLPQVVMTERPDRAASFLLEGQAIVLMDGSPLAIAMPASLWHLLHAPDDNGMRWQYGTYLRVVRVFGVFCALLLPALFLALVLFSPMSLPATLLTSVIQSRTVVPISLFGEALIMVMMFNLINEASTRVPGMMGSSLGLVSALILGSAAVDAALVSPLLIIVIALGGLGSYAVPDYSLSVAFRIWQALLIVAAGLMGLTGVAGLSLLCLCQIAGMKSLGRPYLAPASPRLTRNPDLILRAPVFRQRLRGYLADPEQMERARGRMRRFGPEWGRGDGD